MSSSEIRLPDRRASDSAFSRVARSCASCAGAALVLHRADVLAGLGHAVEAEHLDRLARAGPRRTRLPMKSFIARTRPQWAPATSASPTSSVPRMIRIVTTGPRPGSSFDSITVPEAGASGLARSSSTSAMTPIVSSTFSRPSLVRAETSTNSVSPPHSTGCRPMPAISPRTRLGSAPSLSILLIATRIGTSASLAWSTASWVCGFTPSSAATTITAMSVTLAPRARMAVNASWPGVSRKVIVLSPWWTW